MVVALGFTKSHHRLWYRVCEVFTSKKKILVQTLIVSNLRGVLFLEFECGHLLSS